MNIFIPVLIICVNSTCEFQQAQTHYSTDAACRVVMEQQRRRITALTARAGTEAVIEGTCIQADVPASKGWPT
jgi:hypothetical protein